MRRTAFIVGVVVGALLLAAAPAGAKTISVPRDFPSIQAAVAGAAPGDTVSVRPGTYTEEVVVGKDLNLRGAGARDTSIKSPATLTPFGVHHPDERRLTAIVRVGKGAHVRMSGFTVKGPIPCGIEVTGVQVLQGATLDLSDSHVTGIQADPSSCAPEDAAGRAIVYGLPAHIDVDGESGSTAYGRISRVTVDRYQHNGIGVTGPDNGELSRVTVTDNSVTGGWTIPSFQYGIEVTEGVVARVSGNRVEGNVCGGDICGPDPINQAQGAGIIALAAPAGTRISENRVARNDVGFYQVMSPNCCRISDNTLLANRWFGILIQDGDGATSENAISGGQVGVGVVADAVDTTAVLRDDRIRGTSVAPVREIDCCGFKATAVRKER